MISWLLIYSVSKDPWMQTIKLCLDHVNLRTEFTINQIRHVPRDACLCVSKGVLVSGGIYGCKPILLNTQAQPCICVFAW